MSKKKSNASTIDEFIKDLDPSTIIYLGSQTAFFFIGNKATYEKLVDKLTTKYEKHFKRLVKESTERRNNLMKDAMAFKRKEDEDDIKFAMRMKALGTALFQAISSNETAIEKDKRFKPIRERKVISADVKTFENGLAVVIEGDEVGGFWMATEWNEKNPRYKVAV